MTWTATRRTSHAIRADGNVLSAELAEPHAPRGLVVFAHGSGSGRHSPRNQQVAEALQSAGFATLLADLLTPPEEREDRLSGQWRFDIDLLSQRVIALVDWTRCSPDLRPLPLGLFGASTGAAAALIAAAERPDDVAAVVSRGGRPDLAGEVLARVTAPTLLIVGGHDADVLDLNYAARARMRCEALVEVIPGATHLFEEQGALEQVAQAAVGWFQKHMLIATASGASR